MHKSLKRAFILIGCTFAGLFTATFITVKIALAGHTPPVDANYYEKGLKYDETVFSQRKLLEEGYDLEASWLRNETELKTGKQILRAKFRKNNDGIAGAYVTLKLERSATDKFNRITELKEIFPGIYEGEIEIPFSGSWRTVLSAKLGNEQLEKTKQIRVLQ